MACSRWHRVSCLLCLCLGLCLRPSWLFFANNQQGEGDARISLRRMMNNVYHFAITHSECKRRTPSPPPLAASLGSLTRFTHALSRRLAPPL